MLQVWTLLKSKVVQFLVAVGVIIALAIKLRSDIREDAQTEITLTMEKADAKNADDIRRRVDAIPKRVHPATEDNRGYRD